MNTVKTIKKNLSIKNIAQFFLGQQEQEKEQKCVVTGSASRGGEGLVRTLDDGNSPETETLLSLQVSRRFSGY